VSAAAVSIAFQTDHPLHAYGPLAATAEAHGFDGVSVYNDLLFQPAWPALFEISRCTRRVRIGPAAMNPFICHPLILAGHVALLDEASGGRAYLGLTRGAWLEFLGIAPDKPVSALREAFECIRHLLRGDRRPYRGRVFSLAGGETLRWRVPRSEVPFLLGAWGPRAIRACAPHVDEVKVGGTASPSVVRTVLGQVQAAAVQAGRPPDAIGLAVGAVSVVDRDGGAARTLARQKVALYLPVIARLDPSLPVEPEQIKRIEAARAAGDIARAGREVPDAALRSLALAGTPDEVAEQAFELYKAGAGRVEFGTPHGLDEAAGVRLLGETVLPDLRRQGIGAKP
jgi:5,10-methylenetetrahydromethanopterin reductase